MPIATLPGMRERTITIDSMGKTFSVTGWKVGWAIAPPPLTNAVRATHQFVTFTNSAPFQEALADALTAPFTRGDADNYYDQLRAAYARPARAAHGDSGVDRSAAAADRGRLFPAVRRERARLRERPRVSAATCAREVGVAAIPISPFYSMTTPASPTARAPMLARFCFAKQEQTIALAGERLRKWRRPAAR